MHREPELLDGIRLVAIDRPGYGGSDRQPRRSFLGWAPDVATVADQLGIDRFVVLGVSGGGGYAPACAHRIPSASRALVSGMIEAYRPEARHGMPRINRILYALSPARHSPYPA
jgi:pimeloyl-ACP methyl ester carboxylesterase